jgi:hypothetical protein
LPTTPGPGRKEAGQNGAGALPVTLQRSSAEAQQAFIRARERAVRAYGDGGLADREAYKELKRAFEKRGDHWIAKQQDTAHPGASVLAPD